MVAYNALPYTMRAVESLLTRTSDDIRVHLLDNGSEDDTWAWMKMLNARFPNHIEVFHVDRNLGAHGGKQFVLKNASQVGDWIAILDNDIEVFPNWDQPFLNWISSHPNCGVVGAQGFLVEFRNGQRILSPVYAGSRPAPTDILTGYVMTFSRNTLESLRYHDPGFFGTYWFEDDDWCIQIANAGFTNYVMPGARIIHYGSQSSRLLSDDPLKVGPGSLSHQIESFWRGKGFINEHGVPSSRPLGSSKRRDMVLEGPALQSHSLATVNRNLIHALANYLPDTSNLVWVPVDQNEGSPAMYKTGFEVAGHRATLRPDRAVTIRHHFPPRWATEDGPLITIQPWEYGAVPHDWVEGLNQSSQVWVPSTRVQHIYQGEGIRNVRVVPNGVDPVLYCPSGPKLLPKQDTFRFMFVGGLIHRKGVDALLRAYLLAFNANEHVELIIRDFGTGTVYQRNSLSDEIDRLVSRTDIPRIRRIRSELSEQQMPALYRSVDVLVQPFRAEGFCLPALEAMACGIPVIATKHGGADDFLNEKSGWFVESKEQSLPLDSLGYPNAGGKLGTFREPDLASLIMQLRWCFENPGEVRVRGASAATMASVWTWQNSAHVAYENLKEFL